MDASPTNIHDKGLEPSQVKTQLSYEELLDLYYQTYYTNDKIQEVGYNNYIDSFRFI